MLLRDPLDTLAGEGLSPSFAGGGSKADDVVLDLGERQWKKRVHT